MSDSVTTWAVASQAPLSKEFSRQAYWSGLPFPPPGDLPNPGIELRSSTLQTDSLPSEPPGKPKNSGVGSLSLLQGIFLTPELNQGLLHCRWILYQLSYQGIPYIMYMLCIFCVPGGLVNKSCPSLYILGNGSRPQYSCLENPHG